MRRRRLVATAGALSAAAFAATVAIGANFGLVGQAQPRSPVGRLTDRHATDHRHAADPTADPGAEHAVDPGVDAAVDAGALARPAVAVTTPALGPNADD